MPTNRLGAYVPAQGLGANFFDDAWGILKPIILKKAGVVAIDPGVIPPPNSFKPSSPLIFPAPESLSTKLLGYAPYIAAGVGGVVIVALIARRK